MSYMNEYHEWFVCHRCGYATWCACYSEQLLRDCFPMSRCQLLGYCLSAQRIRRVMPRLVE